MRINRLIIAAVMAAATFSFAVSWESSYNSAVKQAEKLQSPLLIYFYADENQKCAEFETVINAGLIDFLTKTFVMLKIDVSDPSNGEIINKFRITQIPIFVLEEYDSERKSKTDPIAIPAEYLFYGLNEIYGNMSMNYAKQKQYNHAYGCLKLIENLPGEIGKKVKQNIKDIDPVVTDKMSVRERNENKENAEIYLKTAESNLKNNNFDKAYIYFKKVSEIVPGTELAKQAEAEINRIREKVDPSLIQKK
jgi:tetratricopeptide (TPR) repeat protein